MADEIDTTVMNKTETANEAANGSAAAEGSASGSEMAGDDAGTEATVLGSAADSEEGAEASEDGKGAGDEADDGDAAAEPEGAPEAYELTAPEGMTLDAEALELATPIFKELNLSNEQAQKLMPVAGEFAKRIQQAGQQQILAEVATQRAAWAQEAQADPEIGGPKWKDSTASAAKALDTLGFAKGSPFRVLLEESGLGNHPDMIRAFVRVGKAVGEDSDFVRGDAGAPIEKNPARILYPNNPPKGE